jgi:hypothetical protein
MRYVWPLESVTQAPEGQLWAKVVALANANTNEVSENRQHAFMILLSFARSRRPSTEPIRNLKKQPFK